MLKYKRIMAAVLAAVMLTSAGGCAKDVPTQLPTESVSTGECVTSSDTSVSAEASQTMSEMEEQTSTVPADSSAPIDVTESAEQQTAEPAPEVTEQTPADTSAPTEQTTPAQTITTTPAVTTIATATTTTAAVTKPAPKEGISVTYNISNTWQEDGKECSQIEFIVRNGASASTRSWNLTLDLGQAVEVMQSWNVNITASGNTLKASNADYNGAIEAGGETSFGCIVKTSSSVKKITCNGSSVAGTASSGNNNNNNNQQNTTATTQSAEPPKESDIEFTNKAGLVSVHGQLSVDGANLVDKNGEPVQLRGVSTHGIQWFPAFANKQAFKHLRDEWGINVIRLAMYSGAGEGYTDSTKAGIEQTVQNAVDAAIELDMYVIIDWHVLADQSPQVRKTDALRFFKYISKKYADYPNVIYEICNEPNGYATWAKDVKPYAEEVIPVIRANDPDSVIIVGTPTWSQDIDKALADPLKYDNIMYALHYYAATHTDWLRDRVKNCYNKGLPIMVTEFGNCDASGNGNNDFNQARKWLEMLDSLNISYMNWSLCDKAESASLLKPGASSTGGWTDSQLTENGKFMKDWLSNHR